jgi:hypothetical protein
MGMKYILKDLIGLIASMITIFVFITGIASIDNFQMADDTNTIYNMNTEKDIDNNERSRDAETEKKENNMTEISNSKSGDENLYVPMPFFGVIMLTAPISYLIFIIKTRKRVIRKRYINFLLAFFISTAIANFFIDLRDITSPIVYQNIEDLINRMSILIIIYLIIYMVSFIFFCNIIKILSQKKIELKYDEDNEI